MEIMHYTNCCWAEKGSKYTSIQDSIKFLKTIILLELVRYGISNSKLSVMHLIFWFQIHLQYHSSTLSRLAVFIHHFTVYSESTQWPALLGLLAQLLEHCTSITKVMGSNSILAWIFFRLSFHCCLSSIHYCEDHFNIHFFIHSSNIWFSYIYS